MVPTPAIPSARVSSITNPYVAPVGNRTSWSARSSPTKYVPAGTEKICSPVSKSEMNHDVSSGHGSKKIVTRTNEASFVISAGPPIVVAGAPLGYDDGRRLGGTVVATVGERLGSTLGGSDLSDDDVGFTEGGALGSTVGVSDTLGDEVTTGPKGCAVVGLLGAIVTLSDGSELGIGVDGLELGIAEGICEGASVVGNEVGSWVGNGVGNGVGRGVGNDVGAPGPAGDRVGTSVVGAPSGPAGDGVGRSVIPNSSRADGKMQ